MNYPLIEEQNAIIRRTDLSRKEKIEACEAAEQAWLAKVKANQEKHNQPRKHLRASLMTPGVKL